MNKTRQHGKLRLSTESVRLLSGGALTRVKGGFGYTDPPYSMCSQTSPEHNCPGEDSHNCATNIYTLCYSDRCPTESLCNLC